MSKTKDSKKPDQRAEQLKRDALLLFNTIHDERIPYDVRNEVEEYVQDIYTDVPETWAANNKPVFVMGFVKGWQRKSTKYARRNVKEILTRLKKGESAESIIADWEARAKAASEKAQAEELSAPEPADKNSNEWRYWKLRRMEAAFRGEFGATAQREAWREFRRIAREAVKAATHQYHHAACMLPHFIVALQVSGRINEVKGGE